MAMAVEAPRSVWVPNRSASYIDDSLTEDQVRQEIDSLRKIVPSNEVVNYVLGSDFTKLGPRFGNLPNHLSVLYRSDIPVFNPPNRHPLKGELDENRKPSGVRYGADTFRFIARNGMEYVFYHGYI